MTSGKLRDKEEIENKLNELGFILLDEYIANRRVRRIIIQDQDGYKYDSILNDVLDGHYPNFVGISNRFSIENIPVWLKLNNKNFEMTSNNVFESAKTELEFRCFECGELFYNDWNGIYVGNNCSVCRGLQVGKRNSLSYLRPDLATQWSSENKLTPSEVTIGSSKSVIWICENGHSYPAIIKNRTMNGSGCPYCAGKLPSEENNVAKRFPELLCDWDYEENGDPRNYTSGSRQRVWWQCVNCGHRWKTEINNRTGGGTGCRRCNTVSIGENIIKDWLNNNQIVYDDQVTFDGCIAKISLRFDFYLPLYGLCIEYHGKQHYYENEFFGGKDAFDEQVWHDRIKEDYCRKNNIPLLIIPYWEKDNIEEILAKTLL
jgi:hypothetical protein